jgi:hypothetical protein
VIGLQVARQFVLAGRPAEALQYVSAEDKVPPQRRLLLDNILLGEFDGLEFRLNSWMPGCFRAS